MQTRLWGVSRSQFLPTLIDSTIFRMAAASNCMLGNRDFQMMSLKRVSSDLCTHNLRNGRISMIGSRLKACCIDDSSSHFIGDHFCVNRAQKERGIPQFVPQVSSVSGEVVNMENQQRTALGGNFASLTRFGSSQGKIMIAVDIDEVLGSFLSALNQFMAAHYSQNHAVSEYHVYEFFKIWNCSPSEADIRVHEFFDTPYFKEGINPIPGAREALHKLSENYNMSVVTSRQNVIKQHTINWIENHYPGLFQEIHFGNHFALDGKSRPKSEICRSLGAKVLIDDNPRYAVECAEIGIKVLLFDYRNSYPWCKSEMVDHHPLVKKVESWKEVEDQLGSWVVR